MERKKIMVVVLGVLLLVLVVQSFQLNGLKEKVTDGKTILKSSSSSVPVASASDEGKTGSVPSSIKDLPDMVGGC